MGAFKIGDEVRLTEEYEGYPIGYKFTVTDIRGSATEPLLYGKDGMAVYARRCELVPEMELNTHTIYVIKDGHEQGGFEAGTKVHLKEQPEDEDSFRAYNLAGTDYFWYGKDDLAVFGVEEVVELTLKEIADKFNIKVENLRIKES